MSNTFAAFSEMIAGELYFTPTAGGNGNAISKLPVDGVIFVSAYRYCNQLVFISQLQL